MAASRLPPKTLNLQRFMLRQEVLKLYRDILRSIRQIENPDYRTELRNWARHDFAKNKNLENETDIKHNITSGKMQLKQLQVTVRLSKGSEVKE